MTLAVVVITVTIVVHLLLFIYCWFMDRVGIVLLHCNDSCCRRHDCHHRRPLASVYLLLVYGQSRLLFQQLHA